MPPCSSSSAGWPTGTGATGASCSVWPSSPRPRLPAPRRPASACSSASGWCRRPARPCSLRRRSGWCWPPTRPKAGTVPCEPGPRSAGYRAALGPVVGGLLVAVSWRLVFLVNVPVGIAAVIVGLAATATDPRPQGRASRPSRCRAGHRRSGRPDLRLVKGSDWGWSSSGILGTLIAAFGLIALFVVHCAKSRTPLIHPVLFRARSFRGASIVAVFFSAAFGAMLLSIVLWEQGVWGWSALRARPGHCPWPAHGPLHLLRRGRSAHQPLRACVGDRRWEPALRGRSGMVGPRRHRRSGLRNRAFSEG